jgi:hypothetical protein
MDAAETFDLLERNHCPQLPINARQIRPLNNLKDEKLKVLAWERACQQKRQGSPPDSHDVAREVRRLMGNIPDKESDEAYRAYRKVPESAASEYRKAHEMLEEGDLDGFLAAEDRRSRQQRKRLLAMLEKFTATLHGDALTLEGVPKEEIEKDASEGHLWRIRRTSHFLLPCSRSITRFKHVLEPDLLAMAA